MFQYAPLTHNLIVAIVSKVAIVCLKDWALMSTHLETSKPVGFTQNWKKHILFLMRSHENSYGCSHILGDFVFHLR